MTSVIKHIADISFRYFSESSCIIWLM